MFGQDSAMGPPERHFHSEPENVFEYKCRRWQLRKTKICISRNPPNLRTNTLTDCRAESYCASGLLTVPMKPVLLSSTASRSSELPAGISISIGTIIPLARICL